MPKISVVAVDDTVELTVDESVDVAEVLTVDDREELTVVVCVVVGEVFEQLKKSELSRNASVRLFSCVAIIPHSLAEAMPPCSLPAYKLLYASHLTLWYTA